MEEIGAECRAVRNSVRISGLHNVGIFFKTYKISKISTAWLGARNGHVGEDVATGVREDSVDLA